MSINRNNDSLGSDSIRDFGSLELDEQVSLPGGDRGRTEDGDENYDDEEAENETENASYNEGDLEEDLDSDELDQPNDETTSHQDYDGNSNERRPAR